MIYKVTLNGKVYEVEVEKGEAIIRSEYEAALPAKAPVAATSPAVATPQAEQTPVPAPVTAGGEGVVKAPLPGGINEIRFSVGQSVKAGDVVIILEAMKMENEVVAPKAGILKAVFVTKGSSVKTDDPLFEIA